MVSPFKTGNGSILQSNIFTPATWYLGSSPTAGQSTSVYLTDSLGINPGCYWVITALVEGKITLKTAPTGSNR